jgi:TRAP-type mannitol/chloroaromatic compound transport system permease small subunit
MQALLNLSAKIDALNQKIGVICDWMAYDYSSNAWLEVQWYMFGVVVMLGASYTLRRNEHVRVDIVYMTLSERGQLWVDVIGTFLFLLPMCVILGWLSWPFFMQSWAVGEGSSNAGGLLRWPIKLVLPAGFALLALQGAAELVKRVAALRGYRVPELEAHYERPVQ